MEILSWIIGIAIGVAAVSLLGAFTLRGASQLVIKEDIEFGTAYSAAFIIGIIDLVPGFLARHIVERGLGGAWPMFFVVFVVGVLIQSGIVSYKLVTSIGKACLVRLVMMCIGLSIFVLLGMILFVAQLLR